ncbi:hypothetical protein Hanom_Chr12g01088051 [Helianthus anomalus]
MCIDIRKIECIIRISNQNPVEVNYYFIQTRLLNSDNEIQIPFESNFELSKLQALSFMFTSNCRRYPFSQKFTRDVLNLLKSCVFCPLGQTWLEISVNSCHVQCT